MNSCLYRGSVRHRRHTRPVREFRYDLYLAYLDLEELPEVFVHRWFWSTQRPAPVWFRRQDYLGPADQPLRESVVDCVERHTDKRPQGPIRILTNLRTLGYCFNPVSFYYCFDAADQQVQFIVAEITNTPWKERFCYVMDRDRARQTGQSLHWNHPKAFHISPFLGLDYEYHWSFSEPADELSIHMENRQQGKIDLDATLQLARVPIRGVTLASALVRHPMMCGKVIAGIYWQAFRLWLGKAPFFPHPNESAAKPNSTPELRS